MEAAKKRIDYRWIIILILLVVGVGTYFYQQYRLGQVKKYLIIEADSALVNQNRAMLKMSAKPLVWAVRSEMLRNNLDEINVFNTDLVKEKNVMEVTLLNAVGKIINSTDKKLEGTMAQDVYMSYLKTDSVEVLTLSDSTARLVAPVMGYQSKLGVIILNYRIARLKHN
ncbi:hypothetical protein [Pedobacter arcticus]|uniref:hypothetical protein n=1 Tax=Pedobacter arcticus TaxID=752140 RepID=UPI0002E97F90|nr:hypothetical protein [Pedobacter arcticus]